MTRNSRQAKIFEIQEFQITWKNSKVNPCPVYANIKLIGKKLFLNHQDSLDGSCLSQFMPLLDTQNHIVGSQIIFTESKVH